MAPIKVEPAADFRPFGGIPGLGLLGSIQQPVQASQKATPSGGHTTEETKEPHEILPHSLLSLHSNGLIDEARPNPNTEAETTNGERSHDSAIKQGAASHLAYARAVFAESQQQRPAQPSAPAVSLEHAEEEINDRTIPEIAKGENITEAEAAVGASGSLPSSVTTVAERELPGKSVAAPEALQTVDTPVIVDESPRSLHESAPVSDPAVSTAGIPTAAESHNIDEDFLKAGEANKSDANAEWQLDSSDDSSDSSSDLSSESSSDDEDDDEDEAQLLTAEEQARILMAEDYDEDGGGHGQEIPRTKNEVVQLKFEKPDVIVTPDMKVVELGHVEQISHDPQASIILIKAKTTGEYRVLDSGSVLCLEDRSVIGAVADVIAQVHQPRYFVNFNSPTEIEAAGITKGTTVFYVEQHSTYVFTQALRGIKGSDASNMHDEEPAAHEIEFSDDEAEADYKRQLKNNKEDRKAMRDERRGGAAMPAHPKRPAPQGVPQSGARSAHVSNQQPHNGLLSYDDEDDDEMYTPLVRPDNLQALMPPGMSPPEERRPEDRGGRGKGNRSRGNRGRGDRGRGDRGRGDRGKGDRGRGDRRGGGGQRHEERQQRGPPKRESSHPRRSPDLQRTPRSQASPDVKPTAQSPSQPSFNFSRYGVAYNTTPMTQPPPPPAFAPPIGGFVAGFPPPPVPWGNPYANNMATGANSQYPPQLPAGAYVNPAFFNQQQGQAAPSAGAGSPQPTNLQDILRALTQGRGT